MIKKAHRRLFLWLVLLLLVLTVFFAILHQPPETKWREEFDSKNIITDISFKENNFGNSGKKNTCTSVSNWEEDGKIGCTYSC